MNLFSEFRVTLRWPLSTLLLVGGMGFAAPAWAQQLGTRCDLADGFRQVHSTEFVPGARTTWIGNPTLICPDGVTIRADSAVIYQESGRNELIGRVRFIEVDRTMTSDLADYYERDGRLFARGNVRYVDRIREMEVEGDTLILLEAGPQRAEDEVNVYGGRPSTLLPGPEREPGVPSEPYRITGDRLQFLGERFFWAFGDVELDRDDLRAEADTFAFNRDREELSLMGSAWLEQGSTRAEGGVVNIQLEDGRTREVRVRRNARVMEDQLLLSGSDILIVLNEEEEPISITAASDGAEGGEGEERERARAETDEIIITSDRIEISLPDGILEQLVAMGNAVGETLDRTGAPPLDSARAEGIPTRDEIRGSEVVAYFEVIPEDELPPREPDEEEERGRRYRILGLDATGSASTLYRTPPDDWSEAEDGPAPVDLWTISYTMADRISIQMERGEVTEILAEGNVRGVQLEPESRERPERREGVETAPPESTGGTPPPGGTP